VITGRSNALSDAQRREFEVLRRDSKGVVDIVTYDDLLARLQAVLDQIRVGPQSARHLHLRRPNRPGWER
jgi:hypothetical protein